MDERTHQIWEPTHQKQDCPTSQGSVPLEQLQPSWHAQGSLPQPCPFDPQRPVPGKSEIPCVAFLMTPEPGSCTYPPFHWGAWRSTALLRSKRVHVRTGPDRAREYLWTHRVWGMMRLPWPATRATEPAATAIKKSFSILYYSKSEEHGGY